MRRQYKKIAGISALAIAGFMLTTSKNNNYVPPLDELIRMKDTIEIPAVEPIHFVSRKDSLEMHLDSLYHFNEADLNKFDSWIESAINTSKVNKDYAIIINKAAYKLFVYKDGIKQMEFPVDLGENPYDDKKMRGDKTTPEGKYKVSAKASKGQTKYYKALVIDYPNNEDWAEFSELKKSGKIPPSATIGKLIEIHGGGSAKSDSKHRYNWTEGCVALYNKNMDALFDIIPKGTPVIIVKY